MASVINICLASQQFLDTGLGIRLCELLLSKGADPNVPNKYGTPLHMVAASHAPTHGAHVFDQKLIPLLINYGANISAITSAGHTPLHSAALSGNVHALKQLLAHGANVTVQDNDGRSPLHRVRDIAVARPLLAAGTPLLLRDKDKKTAEELAAEGPAASSEVYAFLKAARHEAKLDQSVVLGTFSIIRQRI
jgi:ankyrin repeat protein